MVAGLSPHASRRSSTRVAIDSPSLRRLDRGALLLRCQASPPWSQAGTCLVHAEPSPRPSQKIPRLSRSCRASRGDVGSAPNWRTAHRLSLTACSWSSWSTASCTAQDSRCFRLCTCRPVPLLITRVWSKGAPGASPKLWAPLFPSHVESTLEGMCAGAPRLTRQRLGHSLVGARLRHDGNMRRQARSR
jgi:hypothetical protein